MIEQEKYTLEYVPCFFEEPFRKVLKVGMLEKGWLCPSLWIVIGMICLGIFKFCLQHCNATVDWFTTLYFVGGLGWVPATMCGLSRSYHKMCEKMHPYLDVSENTMVEHYQNTANSIFGYLKGNFNNIWISVVIWILMLITVILNDSVLGGEDAETARFIYIFYLFVGVIFTCVPCAVIQFLRALFQLRAFKLKNHALYQGAATHLQKIHTDCTRLIAGIVVLLVLLSVAMLKSPFHESLWVWLPPFGAVPFCLFIMNSRLTDSLINTALRHEEITLQKQINSILKDPLAEHESLSLYALLEIQDKLREYSQNKSAFGNAVLLFFTVLGGIGSFAAAGITLFSNDAAFQGIIHYLKTFL